jgi:hypothetical protein
MAPFSGQETPNFAQSQHPFASALISRIFGLACDFEQFGWQVDHDAVPHA